MKCFFAWLASVVLFFAGGLFASQFDAVRTCPVVGKLTNCCVCPACSCTAKPPLQVYVPVPDGGVDKGAAKCACGKVPGGRGPACNCCPACPLSGRGGPNDSPPK